MNWLAHLFLSDDDAEYRIGNFLADFVKGKNRDRLSPKMRHGIRCHQVIDAYTDFHPVVYRSKTRIRPSHRRYAGIVVDIFYDHFLCRNWSCYANIPLEEFTAGVYQSLRDFADDLPEETAQGIERIISEDLLGSYQFIEGIEDVLKRLSRRLTTRLRREITLEATVPDLTTTTKWIKIFWSFSRNCLIMYVNGMRITRRSPKSCLVQSSSKKHGLLTVLDSKNTVC